MIMIYFCCCCCIRFDICACVWCGQGRLCFGFETSMRCDEDEGGRDEASDGDGMYSIGHNVSGGLCKEKIDRDEHGFIRIVRYHLLQSFDSLRGTIVAFVMSFTN